MSVTLSSSVIKENKAVLGAQVLKLSAKVPNSECTRTGLSMNFMNDPYSMFIENLNRAQNMFVDDIQGVPYYTCMNGRLPDTVPINRQSNSE